MALPDRIWAEPPKAGRVGVGEWIDRRGYDPDATEFIRADLVDELVKALEEARECVEDWAGYAGDYFREKHDLDGDLARIDAALARIKGDGK